MKKITNTQHTSTAQPQTNQLELLQEQLRLILATSSDGIALIDSNHRFIEVNPTFSNIFGRDISQLISADFLQLFDNTSTHETVSPNQHLCTIRHALEQQQALPYLEVNLTIKGLPQTVGLTI